MLYSAKVMDHFMNPRNVGIMEDADGVGQVGSARCGTAIASSSMATVLITGKPLSQALALTNQAVAEALDGLPEQKLHCSVLAEQAVRAAVRDYYDRSHIPYDPADFPVYEEE